jgi:peroxiredoxin
MRRTAFALVSLSMLGGSAAIADQPTVRASLQRIEERKPAPEFQLKDASGKTRTLADYRGKVVLLDFWATWCTGCKQEIPWFVEFQKSYEAKGLAVVGVSLDDGWNVLKPFLATHEIPYQMVLGDDAIAKRYGIEGMPDTFLIDRQGRVAAAYRAGIVDRRDIEANLKKLLSERISESQVVSAAIESKSFAQNKIGTSPIRKMLVYLPAGYEGGSKRYPVMYWFSSGFDNYRAAFEQKDARNLFDTAIGGHVIEGFILVSADMNTRLGSSWFVNSAATGNWEDFLVQELVPYIDGNFRTLANRDSRGVLGDGMGGYGAIRMGMKHPDMFGSVYALHPVGTGSGHQIMYSRPNWTLLANAESMDDLRADGASTIFTSIFQAHLPNPDKPPLFIDLPARKSGSELSVDSKLTDRLHNSFFLETMIPQYAENLKTLRGFKFDWGRSDGNQDHVYSNQAFTHKLDEFGVEHEAEEFRGGWGDRNWGETGRVYTEVLPFFQRHLVFGRSN